MASTNMCPSGSEQWAANTWSACLVGKLISKDPAVVRLTVEWDDKVFITVHKELLCGLSPYYRAAIEGSFEEANKSSFTAKTTPEALRMFSRWIYTRTPLNDVVYDDDYKASCLETLVDLYIFADMIDVISLRRDIITFWPNNNTSPPYPALPSWKLVDKINRILPRHSPLRTFVLQTHIWHWDATDETFPNDWQRSTPLRFLFTITVMAGKHKIMAGGIDWTKANCPCCFDLCKYHEHVSEEERLATCGPRDNEK